MRNQATTVEQVGEVSVMSEISGSSENLFPPTDPKQLLLGSEGVPPTDPSALPPHPASQAGQAPVHHRQAAPLDHLCTCGRIREACVHNEVRALWAHTSFD